MATIQRKKHSFFYRNGLSLVLLLAMLVFICCQYYFGCQECNNDRAEDGLAPVPFSRYIATGHFFSALFENWESEFLQMGAYVLLSIK